MSEIVEPPKNPLLKLWDRVPENYRLPVILGVPALLVVAATPLLFREGAAKRRTVALETRREGSSDQKAINANGLFLSRNQPVAPAPAPSSEPAAPPPVSSLMRPTDAAQYAGPPLPGQAPAAEAAAPAAQAAAAGAEGGLEESDGAEVDAAGARGPVDMSAMMAAAGGGGGGQQRLAAKSSQFSYSGGVGNSSSGAGVKKLKGFSFKKKPEKAGTGIAAAANSKTSLAAAGIGDSAGGKNAAKDMIQQSGAGQVLSGLGMGGVLNGVTGGGGGGAGGGEGSGSSGGGPGGDSNFGGEINMGDANAAMDQAKRCQDADRIYSPQIKAASDEINVLSDQRYKQLDCRSQGCGYQNYGDCEAYARNQWCNGRVGSGKQFANWSDCIAHASANPGVYWNWWLKPCRCGQLACRHIAKCQQLNNLNCRFARMCPQGGRSCGGSECK